MFAFELSHLTVRQVCPMQTTRDSDVEAYRLNIVQDLFIEQ